MTSPLRICIDAGHGPETKGKRCPDDSLREYQFNSAVAAYLKNILSAYPVEILMVHEDGRDVPLQERVQKANAWKADLYVSCHANASGVSWNDANGIETFCYKAEGESFTLACEIQTQLIRATDRKNRSVKTAPFYVLKHTSMTAILCECGFMTNQEEATLLKSDEYRHKCSQAIAQGIIKHYKLMAKPAPKIEEKLPVVSGLCNVQVNGKDITGGVIIEGVSFIPARALCESLKVNVGWNSNTRTVLINK